MWLVIIVVVVFPLLPVIPIISADVNCAANSISETTEIPVSSKAFTIGTCSEIPGLFMTTSAFKILDAVCFPSSHSIALCLRTSLYTFLRVPKSETNTSNPFSFPNSAAPTPLSPPPSTTSLFIYLIFRVTIVRMAKRIPTIQKRVTILLS